MVSRKQQHSKAFIVSSLAVIILIALSYIFSGTLEQFVLNSDISKSSSLFFISFIIGIIDGFNPCAMWVLIYLITLVSQLQDKKRMWLIVGTFLLASGILYYIILTLWLQGWNYMGYIIGASWVLKLAGVFALGTGAYFIYEFVRDGGQLVCKVGDMKSRKKTMTKIKEIVHSPFTIPTFLALVALAFAINMLEFVCSIALPALYTQVLSLADVSAVSKYFYMLIYTLAFMADDILVFTLALKAIESPVMDKYTGAARIVGGVIMLLLGLVLIFFPELLI